MWVAFNPSTFEVYKCFTTKQQATQYKKGLANSFSHRWVRTEIEQFETGKLDQWLMLKMLRKE